MIGFDNSYARLPARFFTDVAPTRVAAPRLIRVNEALARELGLDSHWLASEDGVQMLAGNNLPSNARPIAMAYAGHQFGGFVPQLGDGRAILLGEVLDVHGRRRDIQLKGSGPTPFSRRGDGRAALGPVLREYIVSEAMAALGIPTTRALAAVATGERVMRETMLPGGVITRVAASHIRVGTFQFFASRGDIDGVRTLADHVIARHYPDTTDHVNPYLGLLDAVIRAQAELVAQWMLVGFIHGVMNTDNTSIAGETIDYGPCAFMDEYDPEAVFSSIDRHGRYAYINQPGIAHWNLTRLAECLLPLLDADTDAAVAAAQASLGNFAEMFERAYHPGLGRKLGLFTNHSGDVDLGQGLLLAMAANGSDFTLTFRRLCDVVEAGSDESRLLCLFRDPAAFQEWAGKWRARLALEPMDARERADAMRRINPAFIPRNHRVEAVIRQAVDGDNFELFDEMVAVLSRPFDDQPDFARYADPPLENERVRETFCGT